MSYCDKNIVSHSRGFCSYVFTHLRAAGRLGFFFQFIYVVSLATHHVNLMIHRIRAELV